jgi:GTPase
MSGVSREIGRQVGLLIDRRGRVNKVFVGDAKRIYLPDIGRQRAGAGQLRGLRHLHTVLDEGALAPEDISDLTKLRLDLVGSIGVDLSGEPGVVHYAQLVFDQGSLAKPVREKVQSVHQLPQDFDEQVAATEKVLARRSSLRKGDDPRVTAICVGVYPERHMAQWRLAELQELGDTAGVNIVETVTQMRRRVDSRYVVGRGKLEEIVLRCLDLDAELVIFDHDLTPAQARAIASFSDLKVIDRTQLILDIFARHAQSRDGKLQVELAQLKYNLPRLTDLDAGLSRLTGGIGGQGPGETKLEINRRRARDRITKLEKDIKRLSQQRQLRRSKRDRHEVPVMSIVGYTNAGKSTLLNRLTQSKVDVADQLFKTLDPTSRRLRFPREREAILTDTVGFIRDLPPDLMKAFRATLEELQSADLLLHVVDISDPMRDKKMESVRTLLSELGVGSIPGLLIFNKCDRLEKWEAQALCLKYDAIGISATHSQGLKQLVKMMSRRLWQVDTLSEAQDWSEQWEATGEHAPEAAAEHSTEE